MQVNRRTFLHTAAAGALSRPQLAARSVLQVSPRRVIWGEDARPRQPMDSCFFALSFDSAIAVTGVSIELLAGAVPVKAIQMPHRGLAAIRREASGPQSFQFAFREPRALGIDRCRVAFESTVECRLDIPLEHYQTRTALIVPFQGPGLVDQAWMADLGHTNVTEQFAVDLLALSEGFGRSTARPEKNEEYAGWGRPILAPAAGVIATVQDGIPNQPKVGEIDERSFTLADGRTVGYGNHVVIDHENGEYSLLVHLQAGSLPVKAGTRVRQGQEVGRLGNSGFSTEPHLHYQLQDRPDEEAVSLPFRFSNLGGPLRRGVYFASA